MYKTDLTRLENSFLSSELTVQGLMSELAIISDRLIVKLAEEHGLSQIMLCVLALGGYARRQLFPHSDLDMLILHNGELNGEQKKAISDFTASLWDAGAIPGIQLADLSEIHANIDGNDIIRTSYIDNSYLAGYFPFFKIFQDILHKQVVLKGKEQFLSGKIRSTLRRAEKYSDSVYRLEPNVKEGRGGLRDINVVWWITSVYYHIPSFNDLFKAPFFSDSDYKQFHAAVNFIFRVRVELHYLAKRKFDVLRREHQVEIAARMSFKDTGRYSAVENFMREYYRHAYILTEAVSKATSAVRAKLCNTGELPTLRHLPAGLISYDNTLLLPEKYLNDPAKISLLIRQSILTGMPVHHSVTDRLKLNAVKITNKQRRSTGGLLGKLLGHFGYSAKIAEETLRMGILEAYIPEFSDIMYRMQYNTYHHYTVDEHTILALAALDNVANGQSKFSKQFREPLTNLVRKDLLALAIILHDIGKAENIRHSIAGAGMAKKIIPRLGYDQNDTHLISSLIKNHLLMSQTFQRRDLHNKEEIANFAVQLSSPVELDMLYLLTYADMSALGGREFTEWDGMLIRELYSRTKEHFTLSGKPELFHESVAAKKNVMMDKFSNRPDRQQTMSIIDDETIYMFSTDTLINYVSMATELQKTGEPVIELTPLPVKNRWRLLVCTMDEAGLLRRIVGALSQMKCNITGAHIYTPSHQIIIDTIEFDSSAGRTLSEIQPAVQKAIADKKFKPNIRSTKKFTSIKGATNQEMKVAFDNTSSSRYTLADIFTSDRIGLLYDILGVFADYAINVQHAKISTDVDIVVDSFSMTGSAGGKITSEETLKHLEEALKKILTS